MAMRDRRLASRRDRRFVALGFAAALLLAGAAGAGDADPPCAADVERLCPAVGATRAEQMKCLRENREAVSDECRSSIVDPASLRAEAGDACGEDATRLCAGVQPGRHGTGMLNCLRQQADALSEDCRKALEALPGRKTM